MSGGAKPRPPKPALPACAVAWSWCAKATARRFGPIAQCGAELGLTVAKTGRIAGRVNPELVRLAKERTGARSDSELLELALTSLVLIHTHATTTLVVVCIMAISIAVFITVTGGE